MLDRQSVASLSALAVPLRQMLQPAYQRIARRRLEALALDPAAPRQLEQLAADSACEECALQLRSAATQLRERLAPPASEPASPGSTPDPVPPG